MQDRSRLDAAKAYLESYLRHLGINTRKNFNCLFHPDKNPSMHLMPDGAHVKCFACGRVADIVDVIAQVEGVDTATAIARAKEFAGTAEPPRSKPKAKTKAVDLGSVHRHITRSMEAANDPRLTEFLVSRGFTVEDIKIIVPQYHLGFDKIHKTLVIPHGRDYYTARRIDACSKEERFRYNAKAPVQLFNADAIGADVFAVTEGAIDALSLIVCGMPTVALGGAGTHGKLLDAVSKLESRARILLALDNDESGRKFAAELFEKLTRLQAIPSLMIPQSDHDFNDFFRRDRSELQQYLEDQRTMILSVSTTAPTEEPPFDPEPPSEQSEAQPSDSEQSEPKPPRVKHSKSKASKVSESEDDAIEDLILPDGEASDLDTGVKFRLGRDGLYALIHVGRGKYAWQLISHTAIVVEEIIENVDDKTMKAVLGFHDPHKGWSKTPAINLAQLKSATKLIEVGQYGVDIHSNNAKMIVSYLSDFMAFNTERITRILTVNRPGWQSNGTFVYPNTKGIQYQLDDSVSSFVSKIFEYKGNIEQATGILLQFLQHPISWVLVGAVLAAPLVKILNQQNIAVHIYGNTGTGKSSLTKFVISLFINPNAEGALPTANATKVGLELLFASMFDFAVVVEDIDSISDEATRRVISDLPYQFVNKTGRLRGKKEGGLQKLNEFRGVLITNGERPLTDDSSKGGGKRRVIELKIPDDMLPTKSARKLHQFINQNYGLLGRPWTNLLAAATKSEYAMKWLREIHENLTSALYQKYENKVPLHIDGVALMATAITVIMGAVFPDESSKFPVSNDLLLGLGDGKKIKEKLNLHLTISQTEMASRVLEMLPDEKSIADWQRAAKYVRDWILVHKKYFYGSNISNDDPNGVPVQATSGDERKPYEEYGDWDFGGGFLAIVPSKLKEILTKGGYSADSIIRQFAEHGFLARRDERHLGWATHSGVTSKVFTYMYRIPFSQLDEKDKPSESGARFNLEDAQDDEPQTEQSVEETKPVDTPDEDIDIPWND